LGRLIANTTPERALRAIEGTIFEGSITATEYDRLVADPARCVTQAFLVGGRNRVRVHQPAGDPPDGFAPVAASLDDAYLVAIRTGRLSARGDGIRSPIAAPCLTFAGSVQEPADGRVATPAGGVS